MTVTVRRLLQVAALLTFWSSVLSGAVPVASRARPSTPPPPPREANCSPFDAAFDEAGVQFNVPSNLLRAVAMAESRCDQAAFGAPDGCGIMQLDGATRTGAAALLIQQGLLEPGSSPTLLCNKDGVGARLNILGGAAVLALQKKCLAAPAAVVSNDERITPLAVTAESCTSSAQDAILGEYVEAWWRAVAAYNGGGADLHVYTSNYPSRVWSHLGFFLHSDPVYPPLSRMEYVCSPTRHATKVYGGATYTIEWRADETGSGDDQLTPSPSDFGSVACAGMRWLDPDFDPLTDMQAWHRNDGTLVLGKPLTSPVMSIPTTSLNPTAATVGVAYFSTQAVRATGGQAPYSWSAFGLPNGLWIDSASGAVSGTPTVAGTFNFTVIVHDSGNPRQTASKVLSIAVAAAPSTLSVMTTSLPSGSVGTGYGQGLTASGGQTPYTWSVSSGLPTGLSINTSVGSIFGTPTTPGTFSFTVTVHDSSSPQKTASQGLSISVSGSTPALSVTTTSFPSGTVGTGYGQGLAASGGQAPYTWTVSSGLPPGLSINTSVGSIFGTPTTPGTFSFTVTVHDSSSPQKTASQGLSISVSGSTPALSVTTTSLPSGTVGTGYGQGLAASGGQAPYTWTVSSGLPPGLSLNASVGSIFGTPGTAGTFSFTVTVHDSSSPQKTASQGLSISVSGSTPALSVTTTSLPSGTVGTGYGQGLSASGGQTPYTWTVSSGLPPGLSLNASVGSIFGTPTTAGTFSFTVTVQDSSSPQKTASQGLSISVSGATPALSVTTSALPSGTVGTGYGQGLTASGGQTPYTWSVSSGLPPGLSINASVGSIFGTPTTAGTFSFTVTVQDSSSPQKTASQGLSISVSGSTPALSVTTTSLPSGTVGTGYGQGLSASGGQTPYTWSVSSGLPPGLSINASVGSIFGTPTTAGTFSFTVTVQDSGSPQKTASQGLSISVSAATPALSVTTTSLPSGTLGTGYGQGLTASGGQTPYTWSVSSGLPPGLSINASVGSIFGTPTTAGTFSFTVTVHDSSSPQKTASQGLSISVSGATPALSVTTTSLPSGTVGTGYGQGLTASGGQTPYTWSVSSGLPPGLSLNATAGSIFGTPTTSGTFSFTVTVHDSSSPQKTASQGLSISVSGATPALSVTTTSLPSGTVGTGYGQGLTASGGQTPYTWSVSSGLPPGLSINASVGSIFGTPTTAGTFSFTVTVHDSSSPQKTASQGLSISVSGATPALSVTTTSLPAATRGVGYGQGLTATGGQTPYTWSVSSGLPPGLSINATAGSIFGTPTTAGTFSFTVTVRDSSSPQKSASQGLSIVVH